MRRRRKRDKTNIALDFEVKFKRSVTRQCVSQVTVDEIVTCTFRLSKRSPKRRTEDQPNCELKC